MGRCGSAFLSAQRRVSTWGRKAAWLVYRDCLASPTWQAVAAWCDTKSERVKGPCRQRASLSGQRAIRSDSHDELGRQSAVRVKRPSEREREREGNQRQSRTLLAATRLDFADDALHLVVTACPFPTLLLPSRQRGRARMAGQYRPRRPHHSRYLKQHEVSFSCSRLPSPLARYWRQLSDALEWALRGETIRGRHPRDRGQTSRSLSLVATRPSQLSHGKRRRSASR